MCTSSPTDQLIAGYRTFLGTTFKDLRSTFEKLTKGQTPKIMIIACSDSRVSPSMVFGTPPGAIFVMRNIANIVPPYNHDGNPRAIGAAIEFAVKVLNVSDIVVYGHAQCAGVAALVNHEHELENTDFLMPWVEIAAPARALLPPDFAKLSAAERRLASERAVIRNSLKNLSDYPWVRDRVEEGTLRAHGWHFDFEDGALTQLDRESGGWAVVPPEPGAI